MAVMEGDLFPQGNGYDGPPNVKKVHSALSKSIHHHIDSSWAETSPGWKGSNWYRFTSDAGVMMPESSPGHDHCGTSLSGWLQGTHPTDINVPKQAKVCFHY